MATVHHTKYAVEFYITLKVPSMTNGIRMKKCVSVLHESGSSWAAMYQQLAASAWMFQHFSLAQTPLFQIPFAVCLDRKGIFVHSQFPDPSRAVSHLPGHSAFSNCWRNRLCCIPEINLLPWELNQRRARAAFFRFQHPRWHNYVQHQCFGNVEGRVLFLIKSKNKRQKRWGQGSRGEAGMKQEPSSLGRNKSFPNLETPCTTMDASL